MLPKVSTFTVPIKIKKLKINFVKTNKLIDSAERILIFWYYILYCKYYGYIKKIYIYYIP
jgi:hypothetical protein